MNPSRDNARPVVWSKRIYRRLLAIYPRAHRLEFGAAMAQLFNDQCRDAWRDSHWRGLVLLWLRVAPDLVKTSFLEHIANLKGRKFMIKRMFAAARSSVAVPISFFVTFIFFFSVILYSATILAFITPETYSSKARIRLERGMPDLKNAAGQPTTSGIYDSRFIQTEMEIMQSEVILDPVIERLNLNEAWQKKYNSEAKFKTADSRTALKRSIEIRSTRNTSLVDITAYSYDKHEAASIANAIAAEYQHRVNTPRLESSSSSATNQLFAEIIENAEPSSRPVRPNKPVNIFMGGVLGTLAGLVGGGIVAFFVYRLTTRAERARPPISGR